MSFSPRKFPSQQTLRRRKVAIWHSLRQDLFLKTVAIFSAIVLFVFVQAEHNPNPTATLQLQADLMTNNLSPDLELEADQKQIPIRLIGPHPLVDNFKDGEIKAVVEMGNQLLETGKTHLREIHYRIPHLKPDALAQVHVEGPQAIRLQLYLHTSKPLSVQCDSRTPPPGFHYGHLAIGPEQVLCSGREENVRRVRSLKVDPIPSQDGRIEGEFEVIALDANENMVSGVTFSPARVRVTAPLMKDPPTRNVFISPIVSSLPLPPYRVEEVTVTPAQARIVFNPKSSRSGKGKEITQIDRVYTISTQPLSLQQATQNEEQWIDLSVPDGITVFDLQGHPLKQVRIHVKIGKSPQLPTLPRSTPDFIPDLPFPSNHSSVDEQPKP